MGLAWLCRGRSLEGSETFSAWFLPAPESVDDVTAPEEHAREFRSDRAISLGTQLGPLRHGSADPTWAGDPARGIWRTTLTPAGPGLEFLAEDRSQGLIQQRAWGPGAQWLCDRLPELLGENDDPTGFVPPELLKDAARKYAGWRVGRTNRVLEAAIPAVFGQKVTSKQAHQAWRYLVREFGQPAPAVPGAPAGLRVVPDPESWAGIPSWEWHKAGVDAKRSATALRVIREASRLEGRDDRDQVQKRLAAIPGIGVWTIAVISQCALGDPDKVSFGDYHLAKEIVYAFTGDRNGTDEQMKNLLAPYNGHRYRVQRLYELSDLTRPRRGPKLTIYDMRSI